MIGPLVLLALLFQAGASSAIPESDRGLIEGIVLERGTREPIGDVAVVLLSAEASELLGNPDPSFSAFTDAQGRFSFKAVPPANYRLVFSRNGYVRQEYGQRTFPGAGSLIRLAAAQSMKDLAVEMTPTGSVSGTIRDPDKRPLPGVPVRLMKASYDAEGHRMLRPYGSVTRTDDRGEYRIYFVTPGKYYLNAGTPQGPSGYGDPTLGNNEFRENYSNAFYPGVADARFAGTIDIGPDADVSGMDFTLQHVEGVRVRGRVIDADTGQPPEKPGIQMRYRDPGTGWDYDLESMGRAKVRYDKGTFEFRNVLPGSFTVEATMDDPSAPPPATGNSRTQRSGIVPIEVSGSDVEGLVLTLSSGTSVHGRLRVEGLELPAGGFIPDTPAGVRLKASMNGARPAIPGVPEPTYGRLNQDGTFRVDAVYPGEYLIQVSWLQSKFYVKEARFGPVDVLKNPLQFTGKEAGTLEIVVSPNVASLSGVVTDNRLAGVRAAQVVLVPDHARHRPELFRIARTDQSGRFRIANVVPGDYKLYAWEALEPYGWFDLELARKYEQYARPVRLTESANQTVDARLIPADSQ
jgi:hypothetical protein